MGRPPHKESSEKAYQIENIWDHHLEIARRLVAGEQPKKIAEELQLHPQTISNFRNSEIGKAVLKHLNGNRDEKVKDAQDILNQAAPKAAAVIVEVINSPPPGAKVGDILKASESILDRTGYPKTKINKNETQDSRLSREEIAALKQRAKELRSLDATPDADGVFQVEATEQPQAINLANEVTVGQ